MLWHIELKFCTWLCFTVLQIKFECRQFVSSFVGVMPLLELRILEIHSFPHFSLTCFDILIWNFAHDYVLLKYRSSSSVVNFLQFLWEFFYLKFKIWRWFLECISFWKVLNIKNSLLKCSWRAYYAPFAVFRYISILAEHLPLISTVQLPIFQRLSLHEHVPWQQYCDFFTITKFVFAKMWPPLPKVPQNVPSLPKVPYLAPFPFHFLAGTLFWAEPSRGWYRAGKHWCDIAFFVKISPTWK